MFLPASSSWVLEIRTEVSASTLRGKIAGSGRFRRPAPKTPASFTYSRGRVFCKRKRCPMRCPRICPSIDDCPSLDYCLDSVERCVKVTEPGYAALAAVLVLGDAFVFFTTVIHEVRVHDPLSPPLYSTHSAWASPCGSHAALPLSCLAGHSGEALLQRPLPCTLY